MAADIQVLNSTAKPLASATESEMRQAYQICAKIAKHAARNFFYAFLFLPRINRHGIYALYAFCRAGDDAADNGYHNPSAMIDGLKEKLNLCYQGLYVDDVTLALTDTIRRFSLPRKHFDDLFLGLETDINGWKIKSAEDLNLYCYRVAVTVGLLCLSIFEYDNPTSRSYAENLGRGMQLTNILRDLKEDYEQHRIYLAPEFLKKYGLNRHNMFDDNNSEQLRSLVKWQCVAANDYFNNADSIYKDGLPSKLKVAGIMAAFYREILNLVVSGEIVGSRIELTPRQKLSIAYQSISTWDSPAEILIVFL